MLLRGLTLSKKNEIVVYFLWYNFLSLCFKLLLLSADSNYAKSFTKQDKTIK